MSAPHGIRHGKATATFETVERARDLREHNGWTLPRIAAHLGQREETVRDWIYYRTRTMA